MLFKSFLDEFDGITSDVLNSSNIAFGLNLKRWFELLDEDEFTSQMIRDIEINADFDGWYTDRRASMRGMVGSADLTWPSGKMNRLAMQLALFRAIADGKTDALVFHHLFFGETNRFDEMVQDVANQIFGPMSGDLRRFLIQQNELKEQNNDTVPASDRTVRLDHNRPDYSAAIQSLDALKAAIREANDYDDLEDKDQRISEISAGRRLLQASRVRVAALINTIGTAINKMANRKVRGWHYWSDCKKSVGRPIRSDRIRIASVLAGFLLFLCPPALFRRTRLRAVFRFRLQRVGRHVKHTLR